MKISIGFFAVCSHAVKQNFSALNVIRNELEIKVVKIYWFWVLRTYLHMEFFFAGRPLKRLLNHISMKEASFCEAKRSDGEKKEQYSHVLIYACSSFKKS